MSGINNLDMFFFFNDTATTEIYTYLHTLSLHDALPICCEWFSISGANDQFHACDEEKGRADPFVLAEAASPLALDQRRAEPGRNAAVRRDRKSTRLNSSH